MLSGRLTAGSEVQASPTRTSHQRRGGEDSGQRPGRTDTDSVFFIGGGGGVDGRRKAEGGRGLTAPDLECSFHLNMSAKEENEICF